MVPSEGLQKALFGSLLTIIKNCQDLLNRFRFRAVNSEFMKKSKCKLLRKVKRFETESPKI